MTIFQVSGISRHILVFIKRVVSLQERQSSSERVCTYVRNRAVLSDFRAIFSLPLFSNQENPYQKVKQLLIKNGQKP